LLWPPPRLYRSPAVKAEAGAGGESLAAFATLRPNIALTKGIAGLPGYEPAVPPIQARLLDWGKADVLRLTATEFALMSERADVKKADPPGLAPLPAPAGMRLRRVERALPRVYFAPAWSPAPATPHPASSLDPEVVQGRRVLLDRPGPATTPGTEGSCRLIGFLPNRIEAACRATGPGLAVFVEQQAPGWSGTVDGVATPLSTANGFARAVPIGAGSSTVVLRFRPPGLLLGLAVALLALAVTLALALRKSRATPLPGSL
jgi:hypothetical protein